EERDHDDRLRARRRAPSRQVSGRSDLPGLPAALPSDHDDDDGSAARRVAVGVWFRHRLRTTTTIRHHARWWSDVEPTAHALHHPRDLSLLRRRRAKTF